MAPAAPPSPLPSKSKDPGIRNSTSSSSSSSSSSAAAAPLPPPPAPRGCVFGGEGVVLEEFGPSSRAFSVAAVSSVVALALLIALENDIEGGVVVDAFAVFVGVILPDATRPAKPCRGARRLSGDVGGDGCCCGCCVLATDVARQVTVVPFSPSSSSLITNLSSFTLVAAAAAPLKRDKTRAAPIAFRQRARGSKFSRRPERSCSVGQAKVVSHGCARACSDVGRRAGSGLSKVRMKPFAMCTRTEIRVALEYLYEHTFV